MSDVVVKSYAPGKKTAGNARRRAAVMLFIATVIAMIGAAAIFVFILYADFLTGTAHAIATVMFTHSALAVTAATSPLFAAMLVGYGYMQKGMRRRAAEKAAKTAAASGITVQVPGLPQATPAK